MTFIRTVQGDIAPHQLGPCYAHEHLHIGPCYATEREPDFLLNDDAAIIRELKELRVVGVGAAVDSMPCDCGRDADALSRYSVASGLHIIAPTGIHLQKYYPPGHWSNSSSAESLADLFVSEIEDGVVTEFRGGPMGPRGKVRAGIIKVAALEQWDDRTKRIFQAAAMAQKRTGAPILTHTENGRLGLEQVQLLLQFGADPQGIVLSHLDRQLDANYHRAVLASGVTLEYDSHFRWRKEPNPTLQLIRKLLPEFPGQIVLGMDAARSSYWTSYGGTPGLTWLYREFRAQMGAAGLEASLVDATFVTTPARVFAFRDQENNGETGESS